MDEQLSGTDKSHRPSPAAAPTDTAAQWLAPLANLDESDKQALTTLTTCHTLSPGEVLVHENALADALFIVESGVISVSKFDDDRHPHQLNHLYPGDVVGETALLDRRLDTRTATLTAMEDSRVRKITYADIDRHPALKKRLITTLFQQVSERLVTGNATAVTAMQQQLAEQAKRQALGVFVIRSLYVLTLYVLIVSTLKQLDVPENLMQWLSLPLIVIVAHTVIRGIRNTGYPARQFGLSMHNWKRNCLQAAMYTLPVLLLETLAKYLYLRFGADGTDLAHRPLFDPFLKFSYSGTPNPVAYWFSLLAYLLLCPLQELIGRGGLQTPLAQFLPGSERHRNLNAIILSSLVFAMMHIHLSAWFALTSLLLSLFWGWIYMRQGSLPGPVLSHWLVGVWGVYILGSPL